VFKQTEESHKNIQYIEKNVLQIKACQQLLGFSPQDFNATIVLRNF